MMLCNTKHTNRGSIISPRGRFMNITLKRVRVQNVRSIKSIDINLSDNTVLFGMNDAGKSNFLYALELAFGKTYFDKMDIFSSPKFPYAEETSAIIDLLFVPVDDKGNRVKSFDEKWELHFGINLAYDADDNEFFAYRTSFSFDKEKEEYWRDRKVITQWDANTITTGDSLRVKTAEVFSYILINAQRDIAADIRDKSSVWCKQISKLKLSPKATMEIEESLHILSDRIVSESPFLTQVSKDLATATNTTNSKVEISPITRKVDELYKGLDIYVAQEAAESFPISHLGLGTRSRAVFASMKTIINRQFELAKDSPFYCLIAFEEPEAHIHPQSQKQLIKDFHDIEAQKLITTHSPYILSASKIENLVYCSMQNAETHYSPFSSLDLSKDEIRQIERFVFSTHGDMLFARTVVLAEGETEEQALHIFCQKYFGVDPFELGITFVGVGGKNYLPFLRVLKNAGIKWFIFSDGETAAIDDLKSTIKKLNDLPTSPDLSGYSQIIVLDNSNDFEKYLLANNYDIEIIKAINLFNDGEDIEDELNYFEYYKKKHHGEPLSQKTTGLRCPACEQPIKTTPFRDYVSKGGERQAIQDCMKSGKARYAAIISKTICDTCDDNRIFPPKIKDLLNKVKEYLEG